MKRPNLRGFLRWPWLVGAIVLLILITPYLLVASSHPKFCGSCHEMKDVFAQWDDSTHRSARCTPCHIDPGTVNYVKGKIYHGVKDVFKHFVGYEKPIRTTVPDPRCLACHDTILQRNVFNGLDAGHSGHADRGTECVACHPRAGHVLPRQPSGRVTQVAMVDDIDSTHRRETLQTCFVSGCHDNDKADTECFTCHVDLQRVKPATHEPGFASDHGEQARTDEKKCLTCHQKPNYCADCHSKQNPHPEKFTQTHGDRARSQPDNCAYCHKQPEAFCDACHRQKNPHPSDFQGDLHAELAERKDNNCSFCHTSPKTDCMPCHKLPMPHPASFERNHATSAKSRAAVCRTCHTQHECEECHLRKRPQFHGDNWRLEHAEQAKERKHDCAMCHRTESFCMACHLVEMPHPAKYAHLHNEISTESPHICANCHRGKFCLICHEPAEVNVP